VLRRALAADQGVVARFFNEARAANAIGHPNIIDIIDVGTLADGVPFLVMEYLTGESLGGRIARLGRLPIPVAVDFACQAADALAAVHAKQIVHRDLKPENLFIERDPAAPGGERIKILDFGIAKLQTGSVGAGGPRTRPGALIGTPQYMSPEQCRALPDEVGPASDIYSLGLILFEMVCGSPPFRADGEGDLLVMHITQSPPAPSSINPAVSPALDRVVLRALAKRREDRFSSMEELRQALVEGCLPSTLPGAPAASPPAEATTAPLSDRRAKRTTLSSSVRERGGPEKPPGRRWMLVAAGGAAAIALLSLATLRGATEQQPARSAPAPADAHPPAAIVPEAHPAISAPPPAEPRPDDGPARDRGSPTTPSRSPPRRRTSLVVRHPAPTLSPPDAGPPPRALPEKW
jgi:serine/threonine-protein kinase